MSERRIEHNRLQWQCRRGMRELDEMLLAFLSAGYERLDEQGRRAFGTLLEYPDAVLLEWFMGRMIPTDREVCRVVNAIRCAVAS